MIIPVRCFTCGKVFKLLYSFIHRSWATSGKPISTISRFSTALDKLGLKRYCCRRMVLTHVDLIETLLKYSSTRLSLPSHALDANCEK